MALWGWRLQQSRFRPNALEVRPRGLQSQARKPLLGAEVRGCHAQRLPLPRDLASPWQEGSKGWQGFWPMLGYPLQEPGMEHAAAVLEPAPVGAAHWSRVFQSPDGRSCTPRLPLQQCRGSLPPSPLPLNWPL